MVPLTDGNVSPSWADESITYFGRYVDERRVGPFGAIVSSCPTLRLITWTAGWQAALASYREERSRQDEMSTFCVTAKRRQERHHLPVNASIPTET